MRFIANSRIKVFLLALVVVLATAGVATPAATRDVQPFVYTFRVTSVTVTGTFTFEDASTTTRIRLTRPSRNVSMAWRGKRDGGQYNGVGATAVAFVGEAIHTSNDPACNQTLAVTSRSVTPVVSLVLGNARDRVVTNPTVHVRVGKFPLVTGYPARNGVCGRVKRDWWDVASRSFPFRILKQRGGFVFTKRYQEAFDDGEAIDWKLELKVKRIRFQPISCAEAKGC
jgi:hypothetical protein